MKRQKSFESQGPKLLLLPTPIGNLGEVSDRLRQAIEQTDIIACEDTRNTGKLLHLLGYKKPVLAHHEHNQTQSIPKIMELLEQGKTVGVMSDAGYPLVSDPGQALVKAAIEKDIPVIPFSGPNAALDALVASGLDATHYLFYGFLDAKSTRRKKQLEALKDLPYTLIFYEAPHRIADTLTDMEAVLGNRQACLARELTKRFEEFLRGSLSEIKEAADGLKGEMVVIIEGAPAYKADEKEAVTQVQELIAQGMKAKEAARQVAQATGLRANSLYKQVLSAREEEM